MILALVLMCLRRLPLRFQRSDAYVMGAAWFYVATICVAAIINYDPATVGPLISRLFALVPFLCFPLVLPRLRTQATAQTIDHFLLGGSFCGILALPVAFVQVELYDMRAVGGAGNALPFAMICSMFASVSLLNAISLNPRRQVLGLLGFAAGIVCVLLSQSRGVLPIPFVAAVVLFLMFPERLRHFYTLRWMSLIALMALVLLFVGYQHSQRLIEMAGYWNGAASELDESYTARIALWKYTIELIFQHPLTGYGMQNRSQLIGQLGYVFTHFHNGFLTATVDSGLPGLLSVLLLLASPLVCALRNPSSVARRERIFLALLVAFGYTIAGSTNLLFFHDIYDSLFLWFVLIIAVPPSQPETQASGQEEDHPSALRKEA